MCLELHRDYDCSLFIPPPYVKHKSKSRFVEKLKRDKSIICYKFYGINKKQLYAPSRCYYSHKRNWLAKIFAAKGCFISKPGVIKSNRRSANLTQKELLHGEVNRGIHVFTTIYNAQSSGYHNPSKNILIPVICKLEDFVASNWIDEEAVFTKIEITKEAWKDVFSPKSEK